MTSLAQTVAREIGTPCPIVDLDRLERNIARPLERSVVGRGSLPGGMKVIEAVIRIRTA